MGNINRDFKTKPIIIEPTERVQISLKKQSYIKLKEISFSLGLSQSGAVSYLINRWE